MSKSRIIWISIILIIVGIIAYIIVKNKAASIQAEQQTAQLNALLQQNQNLQQNIQNSGFLHSLGSFFGQIIGSTGTAVGSATGGNPSSLAALIALF